MRCNKTAMVVVVAAVMMAGRASAFLNTGTLLTNAASATFYAGGTGNSISYSATAKILVANPAVYLWKDIEGPTCVSSSSGGFIVFSICFSNGGAATAFNITIRDRLPQNSAWVSAYSYWWIDFTTGLPGAALTTYYTNDVGGGAPWYNPVPNPCNQPTCQFLMWVVPTLGIGYSGCVQFTVSVY